MGKYSRDLYQSPTYCSWNNMKRRCNSSGDKKTYNNYKARGISFDPRWNEFSEFLKDMGVRPEGRTLERNNNARGYSKDNCSWATVSDQNRNKRPSSNTGIKHITQHKLGHYIVSVNPFQTKYAANISNAIKIKRELLLFRSYITFKGGTMTPETIRIARRVPREEYGYEEIELTAALDKKDNIEECIKDLQQSINQALDSVSETSSPDEEEQEETSTKKTKKKAKKASKKGKKNGKSNSNSDDEDGDDESEQDEDANDDDESSDDDEASNDESDDDSDSDSDSESSDDDDEEEDRKSKKSKSGSAKKSSAKKSKASSKKSKSETYDRENESHKEIFSKLLRSVSPDWKKTDKGMARGKKASIEMEGHDFLDKEGNVLESFEDAVTGWMKPSKK